MPSDTTVFAASVDAGQPVFTSSEHEPASTSDINNKIRNIPNCKN